MPGRARKPSSVSGKRPPMFVGDDLGAGMEIAGAGIIAEPRPGLQHLFERCRGQCLDRRPQAQEFAIIARDRRHRRLLQHDLGQPDVIGIGRLRRALPARADRGDAGRTRPEACRHRFTLW